MKILQIIKDEYAKSEGYRNWKDLIISDVMKGDYNMSSHYEELLILVQQEQQKVIAENAKVEIKTTKNDNPSVITKYENEDGFIKVNTESIINDKNIIR